MTALEARVDKLEKEFTARGVVESVRRQVGITDVERLLGRERSAIYRMYMSGRFPKPHYDGSDRRLWFLDECERWIAEQAARPHAPRYRGVVAAARRAKILEGVGDATGV